MSECCCGPGSGPCCGCLMQDPQPGFPFCQDQGSAPDSLHLMFALNCGVYSCTLNRDPVDGQSHNCWVGGVWIQCLSFDMSSDHLVCTDRFLNFVLCCGTLFPVELEGVNGINGFLLSFFCQESNQQGVLLPQASSASCDPFFQIYPPLALDAGCPSCDHNDIISGAIITE